MSAWVDEMVEAVDTLGPGVWAIDGVEDVLLVRHPLTDRPSVFVAIAIDADAAEVRAEVEKIVRPEFGDLYVSYCIEHRGTGPDDPDACASNLVLGLAHARGR